MDLTTRDDWTTPACWVSDRHIALWGLADWDDDEWAETGQGAGLRFLDVTEQKQSSDERWPMAVDEKSVLNLFSDGKLLCVAADTGTTVWDLVSRSPIACLPGFTARLHDLERRTLIAIGPATISEFALP